MSWLNRLLRRHALERELEREVRFHIDALTRDHERAGHSHDEAARRARLEFGGVEQAKEAVRDVRGTRWIEDWWHDTRYAVRAMARSPAFAAAAILTLAVGIGANTAVWSVVNALMLRSVQVKSPAELHAIRKDGIEDESYLISHPLMLRLRSALPDSVHIAAMSSFARMYATIGDRPEPVLGQLVSGNWFSVLGVGAMAGRAIADSDDQGPDGNPVVVLSQSYWQRRFGSDGKVVGTNLLLNGTRVSIIGVADQGFGGLSVGQSVDLWIPLRLQQQVHYSGEAFARDFDARKPWIPQNGISWLTLVTRASPRDSSVVTRRLDRVYRIDLAEQLAHRDSAARAYGMREHLVLEPLSRGFSSVRQTFGDALRALMLSVGLALLVACANLAGLQLARNTARSGEIATRLSLGASPERLTRQMVTESMTLAVLGGALSLVVALWGSAALLRLASSSSRGVPLDVRLDARVLLFAFVVSLAAGLLFGLAPAIRVARTSLHDSFKAGTRVVAGGSHRLPLGRILVVSQIALSLVLATSAGLFVRTFQKLVQVDPGFDREHVVAALIDVRAAGYSPDRLPALYQRLLASASAVPGVRSAALVRDAIATPSRTLSDFKVPGRTLQPGTAQGQENLVTPGFFTTLGMVLYKGRGFTDDDRFGTPKVAVISEAAARHYFGTDDVVGARIGYGDPPEFEVVGVVRDARVNALRETPKRLVFRPLAQAPGEFVTSLVVRSGGSSDAIIGALRNAVAEVDRNIPVPDLATLGNLLERGLTKQRMLARLAGGLALLSLLLAGIGLYGVISYSVTRRTREMGLRLALGASPAGVRWVVLRGALITIVLGLCAGLALWFPLLGLTRRLVFGLSPHDPASLMVGMALLLVVGCVAAMLPAWRASRIDPIEAMRAE